MVWDVPVPFLPGFGSRAEALDASGQIKDGIVARTLRGPVAEG
jgi:hypothetical protein